MTTSNPDVQEYGNKYKAINLAVQLERETRPVMREAILGSLSSFVMTKNFTAKR